MGRRSSTETVIAVYQAFAGQRTWRQAALAEHVDVRVESLRRVLHELGSSGVPLEKEEEGGQVYWSVPKGWFPGGVALDREMVVSVVRELCRLPRTRARRQLIEALLSRLPAADRARRAEAAVMPGDASDAEAEYLGVVEDSRVESSPLRMRYYSASGGGLSWRHVSVHRVAPGPPARFVGICHRANEPRWFRVDGIVKAELDRSERFRGASDEVVEEFVARSADAFHEATPAEAHVFFVRDPEARWVQRNLLSPMRFETVQDGIRVTAVTAGALRVARFVVSLGAAARVESEALRGVVTELARGALAGAGDAPKPRKVTRAGAGVNGRAVSVIRRGK